MTKTLTKPVHRINRWRSDVDARAVDEMPWCGRIDNEAMINRTEQEEYVTCSICLQEMANARTQHNHTDTARAFDIID